MVTVLQLHNVGNLQHVNVSQDRGFVLVNFGTLFEVFFDCFPFAIFQTAALQETTRAAFWCGFAVQ